MPHKIEFQFEGDHRLADVILTNERLVLVVDRFGISLGFGDKTIKEVCEQYQIDISLFLLVVNVFNNHAFPVSEHLSERFVPGLIDYLKNGHKYYLNKRLPYIKELIDRFIKNNDNPDTKLLRAFFDEYAREVNEHMDLEDRQVFPHVMALFNQFEGAGSIQQDDQILNYNFEEYVDHHSDLEEKLEDLKNLLIKHFPPTKDSFYRNQILLELHDLEYDLNDHSGLEDRILAPLVRKIKKTPGYGSN